MSGVKQRKMSLGDGFLLLLAVLSVSGILLRFWSIRRGGGEDLQEYAIYAQWENVDLRTADCLREGETLYTAAGEIYGIVLSMERLPAESEVAADGNLYRLASSARCDVRIRISVACREADGQLLRGGTESVTVGQTLKLYSRLAELPLVVVFLSQEPIF